jgi:succinate dehydrogenase flavin-adding protein (antitoxin of CptAB toxin-antitoxin module)
MTEIINTRIKINSLSDYRVKHKNIQEILVKKIKHRSKNRGCREMDLILSNFAEKFIGNMSDQDIKDFALLLEQSDEEIYRWITKKQNPKQELDCKIMRLLLSEYNL